MIRIIDDTHFELIATICGAKEIIDGLDVWFAGQPSRNG